MKPAVRSDRFPTKPTDFQTNAIDKHTLTYR